MSNEKRSLTVRGRWRRFSIVLFALAVATAASVVVLRAAHDTGVFELDGNATATNSLGYTDDWDEVCHQVLGTDCSTLANTGGGGNPPATAVSWVSEPNPNASIFTGGGSKDPQDINEWLWKEGSVPDKDDLRHGFAARYSIPPTPTCPAGNGSTNCELLFFGSDRFDNSGDAQQGFWFFQNRITLGNIPGGGGFNFNGLHKAGDLLIVSDFSNGGTTSIISVYTWDPTCTATNKPDGGCADQNLRTLASSGNANCNQAAPGDAFCGIVNPANGTIAPWPFLDKSGNSTYLQGELYEGGVILSALTGGVASECFASVASETRSSTSTTAVLKDFVLGNFGDCETHITTTPKDGNGNNIPAGGLSIGTGSVSVKDSALLTISGTATWQGSLQFFLCGPIASGTCDSGGTAIGNAISLNGVNNPSPWTQVSATAVVTSVGRYCWRADFTSGTPGVPSASDSAATECFIVTPVQPGLLTSASGPVTVGNPITDIATLSLTANQPGTPNVINPTTPGGPAGGSITFRLYGPSATNVCDQSNLVFTSSAFPVSGNGNYGPASFTPLVAGTYRWIASYTGDLPNTLSASGACGDSGEVSVVSPNQPSILTVATSAPPTGSPLGTAISDDATISGLVAPSNGIQGKITFTAYGPHANTTTCTTVAYTSVITITGNGTFNSANGNGGTFTPTAAGNYNWIASYAPDAGDVNNLPVAGTCGDANEGSLLISLTPHIATSQFFYPNDSATITVASGAGNLAGSVHFRVWTNATCTGTPVHDETITLSGAGALTKTVETTNTTDRVSGDVTVYWRVYYDSTNPGHVDVDGTCGIETAVIDVTDLQ